MKTLSAENTQLEMVGAARVFAEREIRPFATEFEEKERIPRELIDKMAARGYLAACFPPEYGGLGLDAVHYGLFTEMIGKACPSTRSMLTVHTSLVGETILRWGTEEQKQKFLPAMASGELLAAFALSEPEVGSDARSIRTTYQQKGSDYILHGQKKWITLGNIADLFLVIAGCEGRTTAFLVDRASEGLTTSPVRGMMAGRAAHIAGIDLDQVSVPGENILGGEGNGFTFIVNTALDYGRYSVAWGGVGIAQAALESMVSYSRKRKQFGKALHSYQLIQGMIGDAVTGIAAARALCIQAGQFRKDRHKDAIIQTTMAKHFSSRIANRVAADAVQVHGGNGCNSQYPAERLFREAKVLEIIEGTTQILQEMIAAYGLREFQ